MFYVRSHSPAIIYKYDHTSIHSNRKVYKLLFHAWNDGYSLSQPQTYPKDLLSPLGIRELISFLDTRHFKKINTKRQQRHKEFIIEAFKYLADEN